MNNKLKILILFAATAALALTITGCDELFNRAPDVPLKALFEYSEELGIVQFTNKSEGYDSLQWFFGDGKTSREENPTHDYKRIGVYMANLRAWKKDEYQIHEKQIIVTALDIKKPSVKVTESDSWHSLFFEVENIPNSGVQRDIHIELAYDENFDVPVTDIKFIYHRENQQLSFSTEKFLDYRPAGTFIELIPATTYYFRARLEYQYKTHSTPETIYSDITTARTADFLNVNIEITDRQDSFKTYYWLTKSTALNYELLQGDILFSLDPDFITEIDYPDLNLENKYFMKPPNIDLYVKYRTTYKKHPEYIAESVIKVSTKRNAIGKIAGVWGIESEVKQFGNEEFEVKINSKSNGNYVKLYLKWNSAIGYALMPGPYSTQKNCAVLYVADQDKFYYLSELQDYVVLLSDFGDEKLFYTAEKENDVDRILWFQNPDNPNQSTHLSAVFNNK